MTPNERKIQRLAAEMNEAGDRLIQRGLDLAADYLKDEVYRVVNAKSRNEQISPILYTIANEIRRLPKR